MTRAHVACIAVRPHADLATVESFADIVVRFALELEPHAADRERTETLAGRTFEPRRHRAWRQPRIAILLGDRPRHARSHRQMVIPDQIRGIVRNARPDRIARVAEHQFVE